MVAVSASAAAVEFCLEPGVVIAVHNGPESLTIAGEDAALAATTRRLAAAGIEARPLSVSGAFHSPEMDPVLAPFRGALAEVQHPPSRRSAQRRVGKEGVSTVKFLWSPYHTKKTETC